MLHCAYATLVVHYSLNSPIKEEWKSALKYKMRLWLLMLLGVLLVSMTVNADADKKDKDDSDDSKDGSGSGDDSDSDSDSDEDNGASNIYLTTTPAIMASTILALRVVG